MQLHGALFDMDGLLLDTERLGMDIFVGIVGRMGLELTQAEALYRDCVGRSLERSHQLIHAVLPGAEVDVIDVEWSDGIDRAMAENIPLRPTVREALAAVAAKGIPMAVVTTTKTERARHHLEGAGLLHHFVDVIGRDRVDNPKPSPEPYLMGADAIGLLPEACAAFEDSDTGTTAAVTAGCKVWQVPDLRPEGVALPALGQIIAPSLAQAVAQAGF